MCSGDTFIKAIINIFMLLFVFFWITFNSEHRRDRGRRRDKMTMSFVCRMGYLTGKVNKNANKNRFSKKKSRTKFNRSIEYFHAESILLSSVHQTKAFRISLFGPKATWWCWSLYLLYVCCFAWHYYLCRYCFVVTHSKNNVVLHCISFRPVGHCINFVGYYTWMYSKTRSVCYKKKGK